MELELNLNHLNCYECILDTVLYHEDTMEMIVPDACPDILRIVDTEGKIFLKSKEAQDGRVEVSGVVKAAVLYLPDGQGGPQTIEVTIPFTCGAALPAANTRCRVVAVAQMLAADTRMLNPRKVLTRVNLCVSLQVYCPETAAVCQSAKAEADKGVEQKCDTHTAYVTSDIREKPFTFSDTLSISGSRPGIAALLKHRVDVVCNESKIIGSKLIFKGEATLHLVYLSHEGEFCSTAFELPFSQIMEVGAVSEAADSVLDVQLSEAQCSPGGEDGRTVSVSLGFLAQSVVREERRMELLGDIYSTVGRLTPAFASLRLDRLEEKGSTRESVRETVETGSAVKAVVDLRVTAGRLSQSRNGDTAQLTAEPVITVLYLNEAGELDSVTRQITAGSQLSVPEGCACAFTCACRGERFAVPTAEGLEVRFSLEFQYLALRSRQVAWVSGAELEEETHSAQENQPSVILRRVGAQEGLWDIAKAYATTREDIMQANDLESEELPREQLLLIPRKR